MGKKKTKAGGGERGGNTTQTDEIFRIFSSPLDEHNE